MSDRQENAALAVVVGASGAIGGAIHERLQETGEFAEVMALSRRGTPALDLTDEASIAEAAERVAARDLPLRLVFDATGYLHGAGAMPEKSLAELDAEALARNFALNAIGPALLMKHFLPLLPRQGRAVFATLSARVGSIGDNRLGGWYGYRAAKSALNQLVHSAAIELARRRKEAICVALHPGTVASSLSAPFAKTGLDVRPPAAAAADLLAVLDGLTPADSGGFFAYDGSAIPW